MKKIILSVVTLGLGFILISCFSNQKKIPLPTTDQIRSVSSTEHNPHYHIAEEDAQNIIALYNEVKLKTIPPSALDSVVRTNVVVSSMSVKLMAAFDTRLADLVDAKSSEVDGEAFLNSELSCQLWEASYLNHLSLDKIHLIQNLFLRDLQSEGYIRFLELFKSGRRDSPHQAIARANLVRSLKWEHEAFCSNEKNCPVFQVTKTSHNFPFDPFSDAEMAKYYKRSMRKMGFYSKIKNSDATTRGSCFEYPATRKPQGTEFDWKNKNLTGSTLKTNEFIFTYDDGPHPVQTVRLAQIWQDSGFELPAFFWLTQQVKSSPQLVTDLRAKGFPVAIHSYSHSDLGNLAKSQSVNELNSVNRGQFRNELQSVTAENFNQWRDKKLYNEIIEAKADFEKIVNSQLKASEKPLTLKHFRLPYGSGRGNDRIGRALESTKMKHYFWTVDSLDWSDKNPQTIRERVLKQMALVRKGIILFHDVHAQSVVASQLLIEDFKANRNLKILPLSVLD